MVDGRPAAEFPPTPGRVYRAGAAADADLVLPVASAAAPCVAEFLQIDGQWWVRDAGADPGVAIGNRPVACEALVGETMLRLGTVDVQACCPVGEDGGSAALSGVLGGIAAEVTAQLNVGHGGGDPISDEELEKRAVNLVRSLLAASPVTAALPEAERGRIREEIIQDLLHLGPLEPLLADDDVTEIMVVDCHRIYMEKRGRIELSGRVFRSPEHLLTVIERIVAPLGRRIDESSPLVDARLPDGSRVNAVIPPITPDGACLTIRKFGKSAFDVARLAELGSLTPTMGAFLDACVKARKNIVVSGGTGSGKTSLLNALSRFLPHDERIVTIEDSLELQLQQDHVVRMEARPPNVEGKGEVPIRRLVQNALRMRPDRIVIGECRGGEALDMLQAMNTGHDGSLTTVHANSPIDTISRLETLVLRAGMDLPLVAIRNQIVSAVNLIVQTSRLSDGSRKITAISEIVGLKDGEPDLREIFAFRQSGIEQGTRRVLGRHVPVAPPTFVEEFGHRGIALDPAWFRDEPAKEG